MSSMNNMDEAAVSGHGAATDYHACSATLTQKGDNGEDSVGADKDSGHLNEGQSFHTTHLGKIPPEIREKIFINLLALPPPFAGRDIAKQDTNTSHDLAANGHVKSSTTPCYHLKGSWLQTLQTCRQIYLEAFPVFYGRKSYYTANAQELVSLFHFGRSGSPGALAFRGDGITSLCVKGFARHRIDSMWAGCGNYSPQYEDSPAISAASKLQGWKNLRKISLCMISHEEEAYLKFLFRLPGLEHGIVDFLDESHWYVSPESISPPLTHVESWDMSWECILLDVTRGPSNTDSNIIIQVHTPAIPRKRVEYSIRRLHG